MAEEGNNKSPEVPPTRLSWMKGVKGKKREEFVEEMLRVYKGLKGIYERRGPFEMIMRKGRRKSFGKRDNRRKRYGYDMY